MRGAATYPKKEIQYILDNRFKLDRWESKFFSSMLDTQSTTEFNWVKFTGTMKQIKNVRIIMRKER